MTDRNPTGVVAVVVAYNRRTLVAESLQALLDQSVPLDGIVVIDNASTDGSGDVAREVAPDARVIRLERNTGGAGGFAVGIQQALDELGATWVWAMDDDTVPTPTALEKLLEAVAGTDVVLAGSRVVWHDGQDHPLNTPRRRPFASRTHRDVALRAKGIPIRSSSFVSMMVRADAVRALGLPIVDYFIWNDDFEFSTRLLRRGHGISVPSSVVVHKTARPARGDADPGDRFYFEVRNKLWMLRLSPSLAPAEKLLYGGSTVRRWIRQTLRSKDRATLRAAFRRGWHDGWRTDPRANAEAVADLGDVGAGIARFESSVAGPGRG